MRSETKLTVEKNVEYENSKRIYNLKRAGVAVGSFAGLIGWLGITLVPFYLAAEERYMKVRASEQPLFGTVIEEIYKTSTMEEERTGKSSGVGVSIPVNGDTSKMGVVAGSGKINYSVPVIKNDYILKIKTDDGRDLVVSVFDSEDVKKEALDVLINKGSRISFPVGNLEMPGNLINDPRETWFKPDVKVGSKRADRIRVL